MRRAWVLIGLFSFGCQREGDLARADMVVSAQIAAPIPPGVTVKELGPSVLLHIDAVEGVILRKSELNADEEPPTVAEAVAFERGLAAALASAPTWLRLHAFSSRFGTLKRIYFAREQDSRRIIGARMYCVGEADRDWTLYGMSMVDGGYCNVRAWFEPGERVYRVKPNMHAATTLQ